MEALEQKQWRLSPSGALLLSAVSCGIAAIVIARGGDTAAAVGVVTIQLAIFNAFGSLATRYKLSPALRLATYILPWLPLTAAIICYRSLAGHAETTRGQLQDLAGAPARAQAALEQLHEPIPWTYQLLGMDAQVRRLELVGQIGPALQDALPDIDIAGATAQACLDHLARLNFILTALAYQRAACVNDPSYHSKALIFPSEANLQAYDAVAMQLAMLLQDLMPQAQSSAEQAVLVHAFHHGMTAFLGPIDADAVRAAPAPLLALQKQWANTQAPLSNR